MLALAATVGVVALIVQRAALVGLAPRLLVGDESEYLTRSRAGDPSSPVPFLRTPLLPWLAARCAAGGAERAEPRLRRLMALASVGSVVLTTVAGWHLGGGTVALVAGALLLLHPERLVLGCHIWPDSLLALVIAFVNLALVAPFPVSPLALGIACAVGVLTRVDAVILTPLVLVATGARGDVTVTTSLAVVTPSLVLLVFLVFRNTRRYGIALPDNTWAFNLMVAAEEIERPSLNGFELEPLVARVEGKWLEMSDEERSRAGLGALGRLLRSPGRTARSVVRRSLVLIGPDTFVSQKLVGPGAAYPRLEAARRRRLLFWLHLATPMLLAAIVVGLFLFRPTATYALPSLGLVVVAALAHVRTRYRVAVLPTLCLLAAQVTVVGAASADRPTLAVAIVGFVLLSGALSRIRCGVEIAPPPPRSGDANP